jgi:hypothetical protein
LRRPHGLRRGGRLLSGSNGRSPVLAYDVPFDRYALDVFRAQQQRCWRRLEDMFTCS